ncbi:hypothetical protein RS030_4665 [Cryptosporidium xiaoi]|uniref:Uncharacterized protein n=1 Tax=Cryptosporidium xiaoi TaxID=659607 RepID=A0AAV9XV05_9CRYT
MENIDTFIQLNSIINEFINGGNKKTQTENLYYKEGEEQKNKYHLLLNRIIKYLYYDISLEDIEIIVKNSLNRLLNLFNDVPNTKEEFRLEIPDLFLILEILDDEFSVTSGIEGLCRVLKDKITGKYYPVRVERNTVCDIANILKITERIFVGFNYLNTYSLSKQMNAKNGREYFISNKFPLSNDIYRIKPDVAVNSIFLDLIDLEVNPTQKRIMALMAYSKVIGIIKAIFKICDSARLDEISEYILNKKNCISLFSKIVTTLEILSNIEESNDTFANIYLQNELCDIIRSQFPYNLLDYKDNPNYWSYFQEYLNSFFLVNHLIGKQISCSVYKTDNFLSKKHVNSFLNSFEFIFDRMFIFIGSLEVNYFSSEENSVNYISPFYSIVINEIHSFFKLKEDITDKDYVSLLTMILQLNFTNLIKLSFSCINNIFNTYSDKLLIRNNSLIPDNLNEIQFFRSKAIDGFELIYFGLRLLHYIFQNFEIDSFSPITQQIFSRLHITHNLFSIQYLENNANSLDRLNRLKLLLDEITILFSQRLDRETMDELLACKLELTNKNNTQGTINREMKKCFYLI